MNTSFEINDEVLIKAEVTRIYSNKPGVVRYVLRIKADGRLIDVESKEIIAGIAKEIKEGVTDGCEDAEKP